LDISSCVISPDLYRRKKRKLNRYYNKPFRVDVAKRFNKKPYPKNWPKDEAKKITLA